MARDRLDGLVVTHVPHLFYLLNARASAGQAVIKADPPDIHLVIDFRYREAIDRLVRGGAVPSRLAVHPVEASYDETLRDLLQRLGLTRVGIEAEHLTVQRWQWLSASLDAALVPTASVVEDARVLKDAHEIDTLRAAGRLLASAAGALVDLVREGRTEQAVAADIDRRVHEAGFERPAFDTIVASGPNSALPHASPTDRRLTSGDLVVVDFGGVHRGYCVDMTRTLGIGAVGAERSRLHHAVLEAQRAALEMARPGIAASEVDGAARRTLDSYGLAEAFGHSTGHGLGIEVHERPRIGHKRSTGGPDGEDATLAAGMVFTVEPGVYLPGVGGVRIEDDLLLTEDGCEILTECSRALVQS